MGAPWVTMETVSDNNKAAIFLVLRQQHFFLIFFKYFLNESSNIWEPHKRADGRSTCKGEARQDEETKEAQVETWAWTYWPWTQTWMHLDQARDEPSAKADDMCIGGMRDGGMTRAECSQIWNPCFISTLHWALSCSCQCAFQCTFCTFCSPIQCIEAFLARGGGSGIRNRIWHGLRRVAKCHGYGGYIRVKKLEGWGKKSGRKTVLQNWVFFG